MELKPVNSSSLAAAGYDAQAKTLVLEFRNGGTYAYMEVPRSRYRALLRAPSMGEHFAHHIREHYRCIKLELPSALP